MGRRRKLCGIIIASYISILPSSSGAHQSWLHSTGANATVVSIRSGHDVNISVGLSQASNTHNLNDNKSLHKQEIEDITHMIEDIIEREEGFRPYPYLCSEGYVTAGYGTKLHKSKGMNPDDFTLKLTKNSAYALLEDEVKRIKGALSASSRGDIFEHLSVERKAIILSMAYQLGVGGVLNFRNMWDSLGGMDFIKASKDMLDSKWAKQTQGRAERHALVMKTGSIQPYTD